MAGSVKSLKEYIDPHRPFSPLSAETLEDGAREAFFDSQSEIFANYQARPQVIVGRRGAGKTAFLESAYFTNKRDLIVSVDKARALSQVVLTVNGIPQGGRYPEAVAELWDSVLFTIILSEASGTIDGLKLTRDYLAKIGAGRSAGSKDAVVWTLLNTLRDTQKGKTVATIAELISRLNSTSFFEAKQELFKALQDRGIRAIVLLDSLESEGYIFEDPDTVSALKGLLKWIGDTASSRTPVEPRFSVPGEYFPSFLEISSNPLKDFAKSSILRWTPKQLIALSATRLQTFLELTQHPSSAELRDQDMSDHSAAITLLRTYLPTTVDIAAARPEDCILFLLRHTQLLPRQLFIILNCLLSKGRDGQIVVEQDVRAAVQESAHLIVSEIFGAYNHRHPKASAVSRRVFPHLPEVFSFGDLHKSFNRFGRREYVELEDFVDMLVEIGAIGKVISTSDRYVSAQFQYNYDGPLVLSSNDHLCVHPAFRVLFPNSPRPDPSRVYPVGVERKQLTK